MIYIVRKASVLDPTYKLKGITAVEAVQVRSALEMELASITGHRTKYHQFLKLHQRFRVLIPS